MGRWSREHSEKRFAQAQALRPYRALDIIALYNNECRRGGVGESTGGAKAREIRCAACPDNIM